MDNIELIVINKWKKWGRNEFVYLLITDVVRLHDMFTKWNLFSISYKFLINGHKSSININFKAF